MITRSQIQFIRSLDHKRIRDETGCFIAEGDKLVREALRLPKRSPFRIRTLAAVSGWLDSNAPELNDPGMEMIRVTERELERISLLKTPNQVVAVISRDVLFTPEFDFAGDLLIGLNQVQDPGNAGTIIRLADWFGLGGVIASRDSADFFSPKVVQASVGSIFRVKTLATDLVEYLESVPPDFPVYGTSLDGINLYQADLKPNGLILMGNESRGLSRELSAFARYNLMIPDYSTGASRPESLNVSVAAAIVCSEFRRRGNG